MSLDPNSDPGEASENGGGACGTSEGRLGRVAG